MRKLILIMPALAACATDPAATILGELGGEASVGLGLYFLDGQHDPDLGVAPRPLQVIDGPRRHMQEVYLLARAPSTETLGLTPIVTQGDFAGLDWSGVRQVHEDWRLEANGFTWARQRFFRDARWMAQNSAIQIAFVGDGGGALGPPHVLRAGRDDRWRSEDDMFERRFVARLVTLGCAAENDCSNAEATTYAEALVQLRTALHPEAGFTIPPQAARVDVTWTAYPGKVWSTEIVHVPPGEVGYGLQLALEEAAPPARGHYLPGEAVAIRVILRDGAGRRLFAPGSLPSYGDVLLRSPSALGLRYLTFTGDPFLWWARKDLQGGMETFLGGPLHRMTTVGTTAFTAADLVLPQIQVADIAADGWTGFAQTIPSTPIIFGCLFGFPEACAAPVPDVYSFTIPDDAEPGTYITGTKARREWMGEPRLAAASLRVQVGQAAPTSWPGFTVPGMNNDCGSCHKGPASLPRAAHGFAQNGTAPECLACHTAGYYFEPDAPLDVRLRYIHAVTRRLERP